MTLKRVLVYCLPLLVILLGLALRFYHLENVSGFDYDQETAAWWVKSLLVDHKISAIGQEISVGGIHIGPWYYYLLSLFYWLFKLDPLAASVMTTLFSVLTMILVYRVGRALFNRQTALLSLLIYALSYRVIFYDHTTSPSNFSMLLSLLLLYSVIQVHKGKLIWVVVLAFASGLAFSVHPTVVLLIPSAIFLILNTLRGKRLANKVLLMLSVLVFLLVISPLLIFEVRHGYPTLAGIVKLAPETSNFNFSVSLIHLLTNLKTILENIEILILTTSFNGFLSFFIFAVLVRKLYHQKVLHYFLLWFLPLFLILSFYPLHVPEYYFLPIFPLGIIYFSYWLYASLRTKKIILVGLLGGIFLLNLYRFMIYSNGLGLTYKKQAVQYIISESRGEKFRISYWTDLGLYSGFEYLFYLYRVQKTDDPTIVRRFVIVVPANKTGDLTKKQKSFSGIKVVEENL